MHMVDWPGAEPTILAIHGSGGYAERFTSLGEELAPEVRVIAADLRGHGFSDKPPTGYGVDEHVGDLLQLITELGLHKPILLGHSLGGAIATFVAEAAGDRIGGLILHDAVVGDPAFTRSTSIVLDEIGPMLERRFMTFDAYHSQWETEPDDSRWKQWIVRSGRMSLAPLPDGTFRRRSLRQALMEEWASVARRDALAALSNVTVPVLVVHADARWPEWPYLDETTISSQLAAARDSRLYVARGLNHYDVLARPSPGLILALLAFAHDIRQPCTSPQESTPTPRTERRHEESISLSRGLSQEPVRPADSMLLSWREWQVIGLVEAGKSNAEIAAELWIAPGTVRKHLENIYAKLGVRSRTAALARVRELKLGHQAHADKTMPRGSST
jgi:pimeloyl-ACP methyl ester carboxylesterase/DNA-binding CsgD family transcriptional regulator